LPLRLKGTSLPAGRQVKKMQSIFLLRLSVFVAEFIFCKKFFPVFKRFLYLLNGYWRLDTGCRIPDAGYWIPDAGYWIK